MRGARNYLCRLCGRKLEMEATIRREEVCPHCGKYLRCCRNCRFFAGDISRGCKEPQAEEVRNKEGANFCDFFCLAEGNAPLNQKDEAAQARSKFESLFRKGSGEEQLPR